jgi:hypothetical protein
MWNRLAERGPDAEAATVSRTPWLGDDRPQWLSVVTSWVVDAIVAAGAGALVELQSVEERPWGAVLRAVTTDAALYFKAAGPLGHHEVTIVGDLSARWPTLVPDVVALDRTRAWMLLADHGVPMCEVLDAAGQVAVIERLLPSYAEMQASTAGHIAAWLDAATPDRRVDRLPALLELLVRGETPVGALPMDDDERGRYLDDLPLLARVCADLASTEVPDGLDHADLHGTNVLVDGDDHRLIDWGDACITHPYSSLFVPYEHVVAALPAPDRRPATLRLRDAYLEGWGATADDREAFALATWVAHVTRAVSIAHETLGEPGDHREIASLLRAWHAKRALLDDLDEVLQPI